jgi:hypothetical protein
MIVRTAKKRQELLKRLVDKMFELAGHELKYEDVEDREDEWYLEYTMTQEQNQAWYAWGIREIMTTMKYSRKLATLEMGYINLSIGLKIKKDDTGAI